MVKASHQTMSARDSFARISLWAAAQVPLARMHRAGSQRIYPHPHHHPQLCIRHFQAGHRCMAHTAVCCGPPRALKLKADKAPNPHARPLLVCVMQSSRAPGVMPDVMVEALEHSTAKHLLCTPPALAPNACSGCAGDRQVGGCVTPATGQRRSVHPAAFQGNEATHNQTMP